MTIRKAGPVLAVLAVFAAPTLAFADDPVPCEHMLRDLKAAMAATTVSDADKARATDLQNQGLERCKADDDAGADALFGDALKIVKP